MEVSLTHGEPMVKNDNKYINLDNVRVKKVNRTHHLLIGNFTLFIDQGNEYEFFAILYKKQGNDYKKTPYKVGPNKFCDFLRDEKMFYPGVLAASDFPSVDTCPWPKVSNSFLKKLNNESKLFIPRIYTTFLAIAYSLAWHHQYFHLVIT